MPNHKKALAWAVAVALGPLSLSSCARKDDSNKPAGIPAMAAAPNAEPVPAAAPPPPPPAMPPVPPAAPAANEPEAPAAPEAAVDPKRAISGTIVLSSARKHDVAPTDTIFLVARRLADNPQARGTLVAVKRLSAASFPIPFTLSARDMMIPTGNFDGEVSLAVRVDKDGDPMTRRKGDVFGGLPKVTVGAKGVKVTLDQLQAEDESLAGSGPMGGGPMMGGSMPAGHGTMPPGHP
jgi:cytochrome c-type biogenesis protein CcmH